LKIGCFEFTTNIARVSPICDGRGKQPSAVYMTGSEWRIADGGWCKKESHRSGAVGALRELAKARQGESALSEQSTNR
jgi:hypothetical protein